jgi:peptidoglycan-associated lipoprotein
MKKTVLALVSSLFVLAACESSSTDSGAAGGAGGAGGVATPGTQGDLSTNIGDRVFYDYDSAVLSNEAQATLGRQAQWLQQYGNVNVVIEGHCDERGTREYNIALGERRAAAVKNHLVSLGVAASRISTISYGKERPAVMGSDESSYAQNRRGVTVIAN